MEVSAGQSGFGFVWLMAGASLAGELLSCVALAQVRPSYHVHVFRLVCHNDRTELGVRHGVLKEGEN